MFKNKSILITGGTGSFGSNFINYVLKNKINFRKIIIFSRDEFKQFEMQKKLQLDCSIINYKKLRFFLGDIRDKERLKQAFRDVDIIIHAAALKQVPAAEYNPTEFVKTNILGTQNIIEASLDSNVQKVISLSTDKSCSPINLYGATKLCADKLIISANNIKGKKNILFSVVRYGNVFNSRGSVVPEFYKQKKIGILNITHKDMTRFNIFMDEAIKMVLWSCKNVIGGEIVVPKIPSFFICDLAKIIAPLCKIRVIGIRAGEKIHEILISKSESRSALDLGNYYIITDYENVYKFYIKKKGVKKFPENTEYSSGSSVNLISANTLKEMIKNAKILD